MHVLLDFDSISNKNFKWQFFIWQWFNGVLKTFSNFDTYAFYAFLNPEESTNETWLKYPQFYNPPIF